MFSCGDYICDTKTIAFLSRERERKSVRKKMIVSKKNNNNNFQSINEEEEEAAAAQYKIDSHFVFVVYY